MATVIPVGGSGTTITDGLIVNSRDGNGYITDCDFTYSGTLLPPYLLYYQKITSFNIPSSITSIGNYAFYYCTSLALTSLPSGITSIGSSAFRSCTSLALTSLPSSITSIGSYTFDGCTGLTSMSMPSVVSLNVYVFRNCTNLTSVTVGSIGYGVTIIYNTAFYGDSQTFTINVYTTGSYVNGFVTNIRNGTSSAYNATINFYASKTTTYDSVEYSAGELMLSSTPA